MNRLSVFFFACRQDIPKFEERGIVGPADSTRRREFGVDALLEPEFIEKKGLQIMAALCSKEAGRRESLERQLQDTVDRGAAAFVVLEGFNTLCTPCKNTVSRIFELAKEHKAAVVVLRCGDRHVSPHLEGSYLDLTYVPPRSQRSLQRLSGGPGQKFQREFRFTLDDILMNVQQHPAVGVGVLLVDNNCKFLLTRRLRLPGRDNISTFGGALPMFMDVTSALYKYGKQQVGTGKGSFAIGPLLSCTNMVSDQRHYVDLTFLATARGDIQARIQDEAGHRYVDDSEKMWYDFSSMCKFYEDGQLFPPVANAFERFCVLSAFDGVRSELQRRFLSSAKDTRRQPAFRSRVIPSLPDTAEVAQWLVGAKVTNEISPLFFERRTGGVK